MARREPRRSPESRGAGGGGGARSGCCSASPPVSPDVVGSSRVLLSDTIGDVGSVCAGSATEGACAAVSSLKGSRYSAAIGSIWAWWIGGGCD